MDQAEKMLPSLQPCTRFIKTLSFVEEYEENRGCDVIVARVSLGGIFASSSNRAVRYECFANRFPRVNPSPLVTTYGLSCALTMPERIVRGSFSLSFPGDESDSADGIWKSLSLGRNDDGLYLGWYDSSNDSPYQAPGVLFWDYMIPNE